MKISTTVLGVAVARAVSAAPRRRDSQLQVNVSWNDTVINLKTTASLQVVVNQLLLPGSPIHDNALKSLRTVAADYVRFVPWYPYPQLSVPELDAPVHNGNQCSTSWNFTYMDITMADFYASTPNVSHIINFSTSPDWMWITSSPYTYPENITQTKFEYNNGTQLRDPSLKEITEYFARIVSWYVAGGFTDECGVYHESGHSYNIEYWEVLNEMEHGLSPEFYNQLYDSITAAILKVAPGMKFVGLAGPPTIDYFQSFFNASNHKEGTPIEAASAHFYAYPDQGTTEAEATQSFQLTDDWIATFATPIKEYRDALSPSAKIIFDEVGTFDPLGMRDIIPGYNVPPEYFVYSGGIYAYFFGKVAAMGADMVGESQLIGFPGQYPSVSMVDWNTGLPNARLRVLQLIQQSFTFGDALVTTTSSNEAAVYGQGFSGTDGVKRVLLVNKTNTTVPIDVVDFPGGVAAIVDGSTGGDLWHTMNMDSSSISLTPYGTAVLSSN